MPGPGHRRALWVCGLTLCAAVSAAGAPATRSATPPATAPSPAQAVNMPGIHVNLKHHWVDLDAKVAHRAGKWLELLACSPGTRDYESLLTVAAKPRHIDLALLMLGLKPGHPLRIRVVNKHFNITAPSGPKLKILLRYKVRGKIKQVPANRWVLDQKTNKVLKADTFLFVGSKFVKYHGRQVFLADVTGSIISLVNFGNEIVSRPTEMTNHDDNQTWNANAKVVPPIGTPVTIRIEPAPTTTKEQHHRSTQ